MAAHTKMLLRTFCSHSTKYRICGPGTSVKNARFFSSQLYTVPKDVEVSQTESSLKNDFSKYKQHAGKFSSKRISLPDSLHKALDITLEGHNLKPIEEESKALQQQVPYREIAFETTALREKAVLLEERLAEKYAKQLNDPSRSETDVEKIETKIRQQVFHQLKGANFHMNRKKWDAHRSLLYMYTRTASDYAVLNRVFREMKARVPDFQPRSLLDFGSGVGSVAWAAKDFWSDSLLEHYCVDESPDMNFLARLLAQGGRDTKDPCFPGLYFRQFLPSSMNRRFDVVVSGHSLLELPGQAERLKVLHHLWRQARHFLVLVEGGFNAGFSVMMEARSFFSQPEFTDVSEEDERLSIFAPCPHELPCPLVSEKGTFRQRCTAVQPYLPYKPRHPQHTSRKEEYFTYLILQKGKAFQSMDHADSARVVADVKWRSKHCHCSVCTRGGELQDLVLTAKKHGSDTYRKARYCRAGDLLPDASRALRKPSGDLT